MLDCVACFFFLAASAHPNPWGRKSIKRTPNCAFKERIGSPVSKLSSPFAMIGKVWNHGSEMNFLHDLSSMLKLSF
jgi:hypothetical protein